jgi:hypothetical protein
MEKIISKANGSSKLRIEDVEALDLGGATFTVRELRDAELRQVNGGKVSMRDFWGDALSRGTGTGNSYHVADGTSNTIAFW